jgi:chromosome segregation ATPase
MRTVEELEALLEVATRERDEARAEVERLSDASTHWQVMLKRETEEVYRLTNERDDARTQLATVEAWHEQMCRSSEKGWAEVEMLRERVTEHQRKFEAGWSVLRKQRDEARAEVGMLEDRLSESRAEVDRLTNERDELLVRVRELEAECERMKTFAAQNFSAMIRQEAEQMREYGLSYEGVRKVLHEYNDGEISFGKLMDLLRAAARAMAEDMQK